MHEHGNYHFSYCSRAGPCWCKPNTYTLALLIAIIIAVVQTFGWHHSNSLALLGDTGHVIGDAVGFAFALSISIHAHYRPAQEHHRVEKGGFVIQMILITLATVWIAIEAYERALNPPQVASLPLMVTASIGCFGNVLQLWLLGELTDLTAQGARGHAVADLASSIAVVSGGILVASTGNSLWDTVVSCIIVGLLFLYVLSLLKKVFGKTPHEHHH
ncbi:MAG: cation transporter [Parcubacteria group bacterium]|nr:cation transporter [Parcubacteria group bacterium]